MQFAYRGLFSNHYGIEAMVGKTMEVAKCYQGRIQELAGGGAQTG